MTSHIPHRETIRNPTPIIYLNLASAAASGVRPISGVYTPSMGRPVLDQPYKPRSRWATLSLLVPLCKHAGGRAYVTGYKENVQQDWEHSSRAAAATVAVAAARMLTLCVPRGRQVRALRQLLWQEESLSSHYLSYSSFCFALSHHHHHHHHQ